MSSVIDVSLRHGDLAYAHHAVLVGHYLGDTIVSAEAALDQRLRGALTRRRDLGLYPGASGSYAVFFNEERDGKPVGRAGRRPGAGRRALARPARDRRARRDARVRAAGAPPARRAASGEPQPPGGPRRARASCLLVGTGAGACSVRESLEAMLRAALAANRKLEAAELDSRC